MEHSVRIEITNHCLQILLVKVTHVDVSSITLELFVKLSCDKRPELRSNL